MCTILGFVSKVLKKEAKVFKNVCEQFEKTVRTSSDVPNKRFCHIFSLTFWVKFEFL